MDEHHWSEDHLIASTAVLAGEIMLISGAEIARIEGTIHYILGCCHGRNAQTMVFSTGIFVSLESPDGEALTLVRRVEARSTNLNRIYRVNEVSRKLCGGLMSPREAYRELEKIKDSCQYKRELKALSYAFIAAFFGVVLGGRPADCLGAAVIGGHHAFAARRYLYHGGKGYSERGLFLGGSQDAGGSGDCSRGGCRSGCRHGPVPSATGGGGIW